MNRRFALVAIPGIVTARRADAGLIDLLNGVQLGEKLPAHNPTFLQPIGVSPVRVRLIDFWATWCASCRVEVPRLNEFHQNFHDRGLAIIGLSAEPRDKVSANLSKFGMNYAVAVEGTPSLHATFGIKGFPYSVLVDHNNTMIWRGQSKKLEEKEVAALLARAAA